MTQETQSVDDSKRMREAVRKDPAYIKGRQTLLWGSLSCVILLALIGLMVMNDRLTLPMAVGGIAIASVAYFYFVTRFIRTRSTTETRWEQAEALKKQKKQERKKNR